MIKIKIVTNSIKLGQFLKFSGVISTGGETKMFLEENDVFVNEIATKSRGKQLFNGDVVKIGKQTFIIEALNED